jgi:quercetin dioxygenase-like cupin family protein
VRFPPRRVVTGLDSEGRAVVVSDEPAGNAVSRRDGHRSAVVWATASVPAELNGDPIEVADRSLPDGTVFRIVEYGPGVASARHRTASIDYAVVLSGEIDLVLDEATVTLRAGDVLVQRGTAHDWANNGTEPCVVAFCLVAAFE